MLHKSHEKYGWDEKRAAVYAGNQLEQQFSAILEKEPGVEPKGSQQ